MRQKAIRRLISNWRDLVRSGDFDEEGMILSLQEQIDGGCQGWDASLEELENDAELLEIMGYNRNLTDEQVVEWCGIVTEAARRYVRMTK